MSQRIIIDRNEDGTYTVEVQESPDHQAAEDAMGMVEDDDGPQVVQSLDEVLAMVRDELGEGAEPAETWEQEAAARDDQGYRKPGGPMQSLA
jgi:hypothetical protein